MKRTGAGWRAATAMLGIWMGLLAGCGGVDEPAPAALPAQLNVPLPQAADVGAPVAFRAGLQAAPGLEFSWDFGDGQRSSVPDPQHRYARAGDYEVVLRVRHPSGDFREHRLRLSVSNIAHLDDLDCSAGLGRGWCWLHPLPSGNATHQVRFLTPTTGWRVGEGGDIFKTEDGGRSWQRRPSGTNVALFDIGFADPLNGWITGQRGALLRTRDGGLHWEPSRLPAPLMDGVAQLEQVRPNYLLVRQGVSRILSTDGGATWQSLSSDLSAVGGDGQLWRFQGAELQRQRPGEQHFESQVNFERAGAQSTPSLSLFGSQGVALWVFHAFPAESAQAWTHRVDLHLSHDGGAHWSEQVLDADGSAIGVEVLQASADGQRLLIDSQGQLRRSEDGGRHWLALQPPEGGSFLSHDGAWLFATTPGGAWRSEDWGRTWVPMQLPTAVESPGLARWQRVGERGLQLELPDQVHLSADAGQSWTRVAPLGRPDGGIRALSFADDRRGWRIENGGVLAQTDDGGRKWSPMVTAPRASRIQRLSARQGYALSLEGRLLSSLDAGRSWSTALPVEVPVHQFRFDDPLSGWALAGNEAWVTGDGGQTWHRVRPPPHTTALALRPQRWVAVGQSGEVAVSTDGGQSWRAAFSGAESFHLVRAVGAHGLVAIGLGGEISRSEDGGLSWQTQRLAGIAPWRDLCFVDEQHGWLAGEAGLFFTADAGRSWTRRVLPTEVGLSQVQFLDAKTGWVVNESGALLATGTGGS